MGPSLSPAVCRMPSFYRDSLTPHVTGGLIGGFATGLLGAGLAALVDAAMTSRSLLAAAGVAVLLLGASEVGPWRLWRPNAERQVPRDFQRTKYHRTTAFLWGADLGFGWSTKQPTAAFIVAFLSSVAVGPTMAVISGLLFGAARASTVVLARGATTMADVERRFNWMLRHAAVAHWGTALAAFLLSATLLLNTT